MVQFKTVHFQLLNLILLGDVQECRKSDATSQALLQNSWCWIPDSSWHFKSKNFKFTSVHINEAMHTFCVNYWLRVWLYGWLANWLLSSKLATDLFHSLPNQRILQFVSFLVLELNVLRYVAPCYLVIVTDVSEKCATSIFMLRHYKRTPAAPKVPENLDTGLFRKFDVYRSTERHIREDSNLQKHRCENLKSGCCLPSDFV